MRQRVLLAVIAIMTVAGLLASPEAAVAGQTVVARVDLEERTDFGRFQELNIKPFFRIGNVFFAELDRTQVMRVRRAGIPLEIVDEEPFSGHYYFGTVETVVSRKVPATDMERLTEVGGHALYKAATPIDFAEFRRYGFEPTEIIKRELPLVYMAPLSADPGFDAGAMSATLDSLIAEVSQDSIYAWNLRLENFQTRLTFSDSNIAARDWIKQKFEDFGYTEVYLQELWCDDNRYGMSGYTHNIVCIKPGTADPDKVIVIGGHWDSIVYDGTNPYVYAPGADDNASGTVATLEIARILAEFPTRKTIIFVPFAAEESGLWGSWYFAGYSDYIGLDIELMLNMDMIGYTEDDYPNVGVNYYLQDRPYADLMAQMALEHTWLVPEFRVAGGGSDHVPFGAYGYHITYAEEGDFNFPGWHTVLDLTANMDFPYFTEVVKMVLATTCIVSSYPPVLFDAVAFDVGDGQSLRVEWTPSSSDNISGYRVYWGTSQHQYTEMQFVPGATSSGVTITGLTENQLYYLTAVAVNMEGNESFIRPEFTGTPRIIPLAPAGVVAEPGEWRVELSWLSNRELDFDHYRLYRAIDPDVFSILADNWTSTAYVDSDVQGGVMYEYVITAVDADGNESEYSTVVSAAAATFDQGILIVDQTQLSAGNPTAEQKEAFFDAIFAGTEAAYYFYDPFAGELNKSIIGQYEMIFWFDDGNAAGIWDEEDVEKVVWYLDHNTSLMLAGWRTAFEFAQLGSHHDFSPGEFLYDFGGVTTFDEIYDVDFIGAVGDQGMPDLAIDPDKVYPVWDGKMGWIGALQVLPTTEVIYTFDSHSGEHAGRIVGLRRENATSRFVFLSMPFYYLQDADAREVIAAVRTWFGTSCDCSKIGDCTDDGQISPVDVVYLINYALFMTGPPPPSDPKCPVINRGDFDCDGIVAMTDVVKMVNYVYRYPAPGPCDPCVP